MRREPRHVQADESGERKSIDDLDCPEAESMLLKVSLDPQHGRVTLFPGHQARKEFHHLRVLVERRERWTVSLDPSTEPQASCT
jgi:hypothetical protein